MAKQRPYTTYYSNGAVGRASTAQRATHRAVKHVLEGSSRTAQVYNHEGKIVAEANKLYNDITVTIHRKKEMYE